MKLLEVHSLLYIQLKLEALDILLFLFELFSQLIDSFVLLFDFSDLVQIILLVIFRDDLQLDFQAAIMLNEAVFGKILDLVKLA